MRCLGVTEFGQSSTLDDAYRLHGLDAGSIADAALTLLSRCRTTGPREVSAAGAP